MWGQTFHRIKNFDVSYQVWGTSSSSGRTLVNVVFRNPGRLAVNLFAQHACQKHPGVFETAGKMLCFFPEHAEDAHRAVQDARFSVFPFEPAYLQALCALHEGRILLDPEADIRSKHIPQKIRNVAYPLQKQAISASFNRSRILNFSEMGCGKSLITIASVMYAAGRHASAQDHFRVLVVCPSYLCSVWLGEVKKWAGPTASFAHIKSGKDVELLRAENDRRVNFFCASYAMMTRCKDALAKKGRFDACILDEAHYLKNPDSKRFRAAKKVLCGPKKVVKFLYLLTGTPLSSCYADLYPVFSLFRPDIFLSFGKRRWLERYSDLHQGHFGLMKVGSEMPNEVRMLVQCLSLRLQTKQVAPETKDFCFRREEIVIPGEEKERLDRLSKLIEEIKEDKRRAARGSAKEDIRIKIMEACVLSSKLKAKYVSLYLEGRISGNVLVWVHFHKMSDDLVETFRKQNVEVYQYDGRKSAAEKTEILRAFDSPREGNRVLVAGINAMQAGVTLRNVQSVFFTENYFSAVGIQQAVARTRRIGVLSDTSYTFLEVKGTFDKYISNIVERKSDVIQKTMR